MRLAQAHSNRRRYARFPLGLPVMLHLDGRARALTVEIVDISAGGVRLRAFEDQVKGDERGDLRFVLPDQRACIARGHVVRAERDRDFVLVLDEANAAFRSFVASLGAPSR